MKPVNKIRYEILKFALQYAGREVADELSATDESVESAWKDRSDRFGDVGDAELGDAEDAIREGEVETGFPCLSTRHYEAKSVAMKVTDGSWVGWTFWYGGGKYGQPSEVQWIDDAYDLEVKEEEKTVVVRTFSKVEAKLTDS